MGSIEIAGSSCSYCLGAGQQECLGWLKWLAPAAAAALGLGSRSAWAGSSGWPQLQLLPWGWGWPQLQFESHHLTSHAPWPIPTIADPHTCAGWWGRGPSLPPPVDTCLLATPICFPRWAQGMGAAGTSCSKQAQEQLTAQGPHSLAGMAITGPPPLLGGMPGWHVLHQGGTPPEWLLDNPGHRPPLWWRGLLLSLEPLLQRIPSLPAPHLRNLLQGTSIAAHSSQQSLLWTKCLVPTNYKRALRACGDTLREDRKRQGRGANCAYFMLKQHGCSSEGEAIPAQEVHVHRLLCFMYRGPPAHEGLEACHLCEKRSCLAPWHLCWATHGENIKAAWVHKKDKSQYHPFSLPGPA